MEEKELINVIREEVEAVIKGAEEIKAKLDLAVKALEVYANEQNWVYLHPTAPNATVFHTLTADDGWTLARETLEDMGKYPW